MRETAALLEPVIPIGPLPMLGAPGPDPGLLLLLADAEEDIRTFPVAPDIDEALAWRCASL